MKIDFEHKMSAHCENGVISNLLRFHNVELSEAMVFGLGSGIFFTYLPFIKLNGAPVIAFRPLPGLIFKRLAKTLNIKMAVSRFRKPGKAMTALDNNLNKGIPTGMVVGVFHLPYFPPQYRFHFNAHNLIGIGKEGDNYLVSDPVMENIEAISQRDLIRVRFAQGVAKPKGKMYFIKQMPQEINLNSAILKAIKKTISDMLKVPGPLVGISGIMYLSKKIRHWPTKYGAKKAARYLGQVVRMQEEIGTGGAGFRFLYAAFLQEAGEKLNNPALEKLSVEMTRVGDLWRNFAVAAGRLCKGRQSKESYQQVADILMNIAIEEKKVYTKLAEAIK